MTPLRLGRWLVAGGALLILIGMGIGFAALVAGSQSGLLNLLGLAPVGVLIAFCGVILVVLTEPRGAFPPTESPPTSPTPDPPEPKS